MEKALAAIERKGNAATEREKGGSLFFFKKAESPEKLLEKADKRMERAKKASSAASRVKYEAEALVLYKRAGELFEKASRTDDAISAYGKAGAHGPAAALYEAKGNLAEAARLYEKARDFEKAAGLYEMLGRPDDEAGCLLKAASCEPDAGRKASLEGAASKIFARQAYLLEETGDFALAAPYWKKAADAAPSSDEKEALGANSEKASCIGEKMNAIHGAALHMAGAFEAMTFEIKAKTIRGPNLDTYYWERFLNAKRTGSGEIAGEKKLALTTTILPFAARDFESLTAEFAKELNGQELEKMRPSLVSEDELRVFFYINALGRKRASDKSGKVVTLKHFPGGRPDLGDAHEKIISCNETLKELESTYMAPFLPWLSGPGSKFKAVMMGHEIYGTAEQELKARYPQIRSILPRNIAMPSSLSPYFTRGYLRQGLGFDGMITGDDYYMDGAQKFIGKNKGNFPPELKKFSEGDLLFICMVYAGINATSLGAAAGSIGVEEYYKKNREFKGLFDGLALENAFFWMKNSPAKEVSGYFDGVSVLDLESQSLSGEKAEKIGRLRAAIGALSYEEKRGIVANNMGQIRISGTAEAKILNAIFPPETVEKLPENLYELSPAFDSKPNTADFNIAQKKYISRQMKKNDYSMAFGLPEGASMSDLEKPGSWVADSYSLFRNENGILRAYSISQPDATDAWNRGGLSELAFRKAILRSMSGQAAESGFSTTVLRDDARVEPDGQPNIFRFRADIEEVSSAVSALGKNKDFAEVYSGQNWNGDEWKAAFSAFYKKLIAGGYADLNP